MSLDVSLVGPKQIVSCTCRECSNEHTREDRDEYYSSNITHNLGQMAQEAGIYEALWRPEEMNPPARFARDISDILSRGLKDLESRPEHFKQFNASNGWGTYKHFVPFVREYLNACLEFPDAEISVSR